MKRLIYALPLLLFVYLLAISCSKDKPTQSGAGAPTKVLILEDNGTQDTLQFILDSAGFDVTMGGLYYDYTNTNFSAYDLVILLNGVNYGYDIEDSIQTALINYVNGGGVLLTTEWLLEEGNNTIIESILPVSYNSLYAYNGETYLKVTSNAITAGVPDSFDTRAGWSAIYMVDNPASLSTNHVVLFNGKASGPALTMGTYGTGRTIHWAMAGQYWEDDIWSPEVRRIFINIANFSKGI